MTTDSRRRAAAGVLPKLVVLLDHAAATPLHTQLYQQMRAAILAGRLPRGTRLPSTRDLAGDLGVSRNTVLSAFEQLSAESYLDGHVGDGTYVSRELPDDLLQVPPSAGRPDRGTEARLSGVGLRMAQSAPAVADYRGKPRPFRTSTPALDAFPYDTWARLTGRRWRQSAPELLTYGDPRGYRPLRETLAHYLNAARGMRCDADRIVLTAGSQQALDLAARLLIDPGDAAWLEDPGFRGARAALACAGARLVPVPIDAEGLAVETAIDRAPDARLAYVTPSHQYPLGPTLALRRRLALLKWASRTGAWILEDDYDSEFRYAGRPLPALQGIDTDGRVIYIGTFSKVLFPAIQVGYIVAPPALVPAITAARSLNGHAAATLDQAVLCDFMADGHFARHVRRMRLLYAQRQRALVAAARRELDGLLEVRPSDAGMHLIGWLPAGADDTAACDAAARQGVEVTPLSAYCLESGVPPALRLGYTGYTPRQIWEATRRLATALRTLKRPSAGGRRRADSGR